MAQVASSHPLGNMNDLGLDPGAVQQLARHLKDSLSGFNRELRKTAENELEKLKSNPEFNKYLAFIFGCAEPPSGLELPPSDFHLVRSSAGTYLKNNVRLSYREIPDSNLELIRQVILQCLRDNNSQIRSYAGNIATELVRRGGLSRWLPFISDLLDMAGDSTGSISIEGKTGALSALSKICEDNEKLLARAYNGNRPLNTILPRLVTFTANPSLPPMARIHALKAVGVFVPGKSQAMLNCVDPLLQNLFLLATDTNVDVRCQVCQILVQLVEIRPDKIQPHLPGLVDYFITQQQSEEEELAVAAGGFFLSIAEHDTFWESLKPYMERIIPVLLSCMVYTGEDIALLGGASDDEAEDDREEDVKPIFALKKSSRNTNADGTEPKDKNGYSKMTDAADDDDELEEGEIDDLDDLGDEDPDERWTVRKCSAATLDIIAVKFGDAIFQCILPWLVANLKHDQWPHREAAVLALGAVAEGCMNGVAPNLPELVPYLLSLLNDEEPIVRQITCWTLGRYSGWAVDRVESGQAETYFAPMMEGLLVKMLDKNKKVQEAAASAMTFLQEKAGSKLDPYCEPIIQQYVRCFGKYKDKNMYILYDCVKILVESVGPSIAPPARSGPLMAALDDRYQKVTDESRELFPLFDCLSYVAMSLATNFLPYAPPIVARCVNIIHRNLEQVSTAVSDPTVDHPDKDFLVTSLDLLSCIMQGIGAEKSPELIAKHSPMFFELLSFCMENPADEVRQSAYALLGDSARYIFPQLRPFIPQLFPILLKQLDDFDTVLDEEMDTWFGVISNACWSAGEIAMQDGKSLTPFANELRQLCTKILLEKMVPKSVSENAGITLGRLALENYEQLAPFLGDFGEHFLESMDEVDPTEEKATAFKGFSLVVMKNPQALQNQSGTLLHFMHSIATYENLQLRKPVSVGLQEVFQGVLNQTRAMFGDNDTFRAFLQQMNPTELEALTLSYAV